MRRAEEKTCCIFLNFFYAIIKNVRFCSRVKGRRRCNGPHIQEGRDATGLMKPSGFRG